MGMYSEKFEKAVKFVIQNEGGYVNDPTDPGGETNMGISKRSYPNLNIKKLTLEDAKKIYYCDYWNKGKCEQIQDESIATKYFDFIVLFGHRAATIVLQRALCVGDIFVKEDGLMGLQTLSGVIFSEAKILLAGMKAEAAGYCRLIVQKSPTQQKYLNGWLNRIYRNVEGG